MHIAASKKEDIHDLASYGFRQKSDGGSRRTIKSQKVGDCVSMVMNI